MRPNFRHARTAAAVAAFALALTACGSDDAAVDSGDEGATESVSFTAPEDGATVTSPVTIEMSAEGLTIEEAGEVTEGAGHFHIMVDTGCVTPGEVITKDDSHVHFGDGSTTTELELEPGEHTLCLQVGDGAHTALEPTDEITITVE